MAKKTKPAAIPAIPLAGSERKPIAGARLVGPVPKHETISATLVLRRPIASASSPVWLEGEVLSRAAFAAMHGADAEDIAAVEAFAHEYGLTLVATTPAARSITLSGSAAQMQMAFGVELKHYKQPRKTELIRCRSGTLSLPQDLHARVVAVLGLDSRPVAKPHFRRVRANASKPTSFTPPQLAQLYGFPGGVNGAGQTIAIIELGGGYQTADLNAYFSALGLASPAVAAVAVDGGKNQPGSDADGEVMLDIEVAGSIANGAKIAVYFAPNTDQGFHDAITTAIHDAVRKPSVLSISWGGPENSWTAQARDAMNAALQDAAMLGVTVTVAAGDNGSGDGATDGSLNVDFPASSPYALACGGTTLKAAAGKITSETVWNETKFNEGATGGGVSQYFALPAYQNKAGVPAQPTTKFAGRGVPDVAGDADPTTGYAVRVDGKDQVIGGTSAVAPLWAALVALLNQQAGKPLGFINPQLYALGESAFNDIIKGNNGKYKAGKGWDACTGLGSPKAAVLKSGLKAG